MASAKAAEFTIYRMHSSAFAASDSTGAMRAPGRWHSQGTRVVYAAEHISLALLETLIHAGGRKLPPRSLTSITVPATVMVETSKWLDDPASRAFGDLWVKSARTAILRVPSIAVNKLEDNFVLNPAHPDFHKIRFNKPEPFALDPRYLTL
ncbi:RES family NAD+ phosphorylase [Terriglobus saanensis]|uniref:RES domain protein n=1 Tax=Terriglobus saanensis (strain ATCC BAA-1853 / DSM 23119 / SP1PR4) TaxID=401053 RepID=E8V0R9_TERSS|nr:RES domain-containing protein [Terriglobus saanensis]ADV81132.1 RES domain protein [Terriglobus saanensis SP1PR4]